MSTFVLVHGAAHGRWCWDLVIPLLKDAGHQVVAIDLPGLGHDQTPIADVSLSLYARAVEAAVRTQSEPVVLVGHSMGGMVITQAAEYAPERVARLVYLTAFLPANGQCLLELLLPSDGSQLKFDISEDGSYSTVTPEIALSALYADVDEQVALEDIARLRPQPLAPMATPVETTQERFGSIPRHYIECLQDRAIPIVTQRRMVAAQPCLSVDTLDASHSPCLSMPGDVARILLSIAALTAK